MVLDQKIWDSLIVANAADGGLLQSWAWGEFQEKVKSKNKKEKKGDIIFRVATKDIFGQLIKYDLPLGQSYLYCPRGPVFEKGALLESWFKEVRKIAKQEGCFFLKIEPTVDIDFKSYGFKKVADVQPSQTLILDLTKSETGLLAEMKQKHRYNIGLSEKKGVKVSFTKDKKKLSDFINLVGKTSDRQGIRPHGSEYYQKMFSVLADQNLIELAMAEHEGKIIAANLITYFGGTATYLHGGTDNEVKRLMAPHLLQWQSIKRAKEKKMKLYDFGGVSDVKPKWQGITRFKQGFSPDTNFIQFPGTYDLSYSKVRYNIFQIVKKFK